MKDARAVVTFAFPLFLVRRFAYSTTFAPTTRGRTSRLCSAPFLFLFLVHLSFSLFLLLEKESLEKFWRRRRILFFHLVMSSTVHFQRFSFVTSQPMRIRILLYLKMKLQVNILSIRRKKEEKNDAASQQTCKSIETQHDTGIHDKNFLDFCREFRPPGSCGC